MNGINDNNDENDDDAINCDERTCMTLSEFKAKWMVILQRRRIASIVSHQRTIHSKSTTTTKNENNNYKKNKNDVNTETDDHNNSSTKRRFDIERLRKRRRLGRKNHLPRESQKPNVNENGHVNVDDDDDDDDCDPYECYHQVKIPSSHDAIDMVVDETIQQWRALDERKISAATVVPVPTDNNNNNNNNNTIKTLPKWYEKHVRLPVGFDYASIRKTPPDEEENDDDNNTADRVINFMDPTQPLLYSTELWKLFRSIPTRQQIEESICHPHQLPNTHRWFHDKNNNNNNTNENEEENNGGGGDYSNGGAILQGTKSCPSHDWDYYGLSRFRLNDRHDLPPIHFLSTPPLNNDATTTLNIDTVVIPDYCGLLRLECVRKQLRRTSTPDPNRMVLEFLGSQTLYHVHCAIVELTDDELWYDYAKNVPISSIVATNSDDENDNDGDDDEYVDDDPTTRNRKSPQQGPEPVPPPITSPDCTNTVNDRASSGYFFIENTFYTTGPVDYTTPILQWLQSGTVRQQKRRMEHLGIGPSLPTIRPMTDMILDNLPTRLGIRYVHVHNGDVECAIFVTDRRLMLPEQVQQIHQFPIIHDIWTSSYSVPECDYCQNRVAVIATSTECEVTNGHAALCEVCCRQLRLQRTSRHHIERYTVWRGQSDLSAGASNEVAW